MWHNLPMRSKLYCECIYHGQLATDLSSLDVLEKNMDKNQWTFIDNKANSWYVVWLNENAHSLWMGCFKSIACQKSAHEYFPACLSIAATLITVWYHWPAHFRWNWWTFKLLFKNVLPQNRNQLWRILIIKNLN